MQDLPFHLATIRILRSFTDPAFGFDHNFVLTLGRTQYVIYYIVGAAIALFTGVVGSNVVLVSAYLGGTVLALRSLLGALGRDERLSLLVVPLLVNVMFVYGLLPFVEDHPAHALGPRRGRAPFRAAGVGLGHAPMRARAGDLLLPRPSVRSLLHRLRGHVPVDAAVERRCAPPPCAPGRGVLVWWMFFTAAGRLARGAAIDNGADPHKALDGAIADLPNWFVNVFRDTSDELTIVALAMLVVGALGLSFGDPDRSRPFSRAYALVPLSCIVFYFVLPDGHGYIWLISQRFPILFAMTAIPLLRMPRGARGLGVAGAALALGVASIVNVCRHFIRFELDEVGDIDAAIDAMEPNRKVCALIYDKASSIMNNQPFLHFGSYYQVRKGGVVMFTYAGYAHWPFDFQPGKYPPPGGPARLRWEWTPESVPMREIYPYYDYVLTRGGGFRPLPGTYHLKFRDARWAVWEKDAG